MLKIRPNSMATLRKLGEMYIFTLRMLTWVMNKETAKGAEGAQMPSNRFHKKFR